jgi:hypothetical protein
MIDALAAIPMRVGADVKILLRRDGEGGEKGQRAEGASETGELHMAYGIPE